MIKGGFGQDKKIVPIIEFDYEALDRNLFPEQEAEQIKRDLSEEAIQVGLKLFALLMRWVWQDGSKNPDGIQIRAMIGCWISIEELRPLTLTELATGFGKRKQSLGRHADNFKKTFPYLVNSHMRAINESDKTK